MTLGKKIKKYRVNKGLTQKALGERALGQKGDKALRIYKYENDVIVPKPEVRRSIADALDVDVEALSDIAITSNEDIMYILFELEETKGLRIHKDNGHIILDFDDQELKNNEQLFAYLSLWADESSRNKTTDADKNAYEHWKGRFVTNAHDFNGKDYLQKLILVKANGHCELCNGKAPFMDKNGEPYLVIYQIDPNYKEREPEKNLLALCPNCHAKMMMNPSENDLEKIKEIADNHTI